MLKCENCGEMFETAENVVKSEILGEFRRTYDVDVCPYCESEEIEEINKCICEQGTEDEFCEDCKEACRKGVAYMLEHFLPDEWKKADAIDIANLVEEALSGTDNY